MKLAAERDLIARQYANGFAELWDVGLPVLSEIYRASGSLERAIVQCQLTLMSTVPDTLILARRGRRKRNAVACWPRRYWTRVGPTPSRSAFVWRIRWLVARRRPSPQSRSHRRSGDGLLVRWALAKYHTLAGPFGAVWWFGLCLNVIEFV